MRLSSKMCAYCAELLKESQTCGERTQHKAKERTWSHEKIMWPQGHARLITGLCFS